MSILDVNRFDAEVVLSSDKDRGVWGYEVTTKQPAGGRTRSYRAGGQCPTSTTKHGLLAVALITAISSIPSGQAQRLAREAGQPKARLNIILRDPTFAGALRGKIQRDATAKPLRIGRNLLIELARVLARFEITWSTDAESRIAMVVQNWAYNHLRDFRALTGVFAPVVVSTAV